METNDATPRESALLVGGPADGLRATVANRPAMLQVTYPCVVGEPDSGVRVEALHVYRLVPPVQDELLRYGYDPASP
ncbi:hypothetical protein ACFU6I_36040 [Streptomyces sp. NPDC057486]|uniref:hypothetical protein n=1 Tax=Streptomyces sp. NPDC057486 TaxID=3346145 RepID=UPI0036769052